MPDKITIEDLEVHFHVGVPDEERAKPQKLLITIEMTKDLRPSAANDNLTETIDYFAVNQAVKALGQARRWKLIEALADDICELVLCTFKPDAVRVVIKKFILPTPAGSVSKCAGRQLELNPLLLFATHITDKTGITIRTDCE